MINAIYLLHHTHTDFGYTDLPSTCWSLHARYIEQAVAFCERFADYPDAARFRWTCETLWPVQRFLAEAPAECRQRFDRCFDRGLIDVAAAPFHTSSLMDLAEWESLRDDLAPLYARYAPAGVFQNDVTGFPWGLAELWRQAGVRLLLNAPNTYSTPGRLRQAPATFWWETGAGHRLLTHLSEGYCEGFHYFHDAEWRRGPVPAASNVWHNPPEPGDVFDPSPTGLRKAHARCRQRLGRLPTDYPFAILPLQVTNMWRLDNDPPLPGLSDFVRAWNDAGLQPTLRLATLREVAAELHAEAPSAPLEVVRGDWGDWWADILTSVPGELALVQAARRRLADVPAGAEMLGTPRSVGQHETNAAWRDVSEFTEHTLGSFDSVPQPYGPLTLGNAAELMASAYRADERARLAQTAVLRAAPSYAPLSATDHLLVFNPGAEPRDAWVEISASAIRSRVNAVQELESGRVLPLETLLAPVWSTSTPDVATPFEVPQDAWSFQPTTRRFRPGPFSPHEWRQYRLLFANATDPSAAATATALGEFGFDTRRGCPQRLTDRSSGHDWIDDDAGVALGTLVVETYDVFGARDRLLAHSAAYVAEHAQRRAPKLIRSEKVPSAYGDRYVSAFEHPHFHRIEQTWDWFADRARLELTTTLWIREHTGPQALYLAFPLRLPGALAWYNAAGQPTRAGIDQVPGSCAEFHVVHDGVRFVGPQGLQAVLATPDTPLGCFDSIALRTGRTAFVPETARFFSLVHANYWLTNAPVTKAAKLVLRHMLTWGGPGSPPADPRAGCGELWAMPCRPERFTDLRSATTACRDCGLV